MKQIGLSVLSILAVLILFAGCGKDEKVDISTSLASLYLPTVNSNVTADHITTKGPEGLTYVATIVSQDKPDWCWFDSDSKQLETTGKVGEKIEIQMDRNQSDKDREASIRVTFSNGYKATLTLTQTKFSTTPEYDKAWAEQPLYRQNSDYIYKTYYTNIAGRGRARNYSICYDKERRISHWVAYPLSTQYTLPKVDRTDLWAYDPNTQLPVIPDDEQQYIVGTYGVSGFSRGHQCPSADRYNTISTNAMTFYATNLMPQNSTFNSKIWTTLEGNIRQSMALMRTDTMYVVTGTYFGDSRTIQDRKGNQIAVPSNCWKVLLRTKAGNIAKPIQECTADELIGIGFWFRNDTSNTSGLSTYVKSIAEIEALTGFTFFHNLPKDAVLSVKNQKSLRDWGFQ